MAGVRSPTPTTKIPGLKAWVHQKRSLAWLYLPTTFPLVLFRILKHDLSKKWLTDLCEQTFVEIFFSLQYTSGLLNKYYYNENGL
jgi:hypothetical protein